MYTVGHLQDDSSHEIVSGHTLQEVQSLVVWDRKNKCSTISNINPLLAIYANTNIASLYLIYTYYCYAQMKIKCLLKYIHINEQYSLPFNSSLEYLHAPVYALYNLCIKLFISDIVLRPSPSSDFSSQVFFYHV